MEDILSQGGDRGPSRWPRRLAVIGAGVLVVVLGVVYLSRASHSHSPAAAPSTPVSASAAEPGRIAGPDLPMAGSLRLPLAGAQPAWFSPATGVSARIGGLPADSAGYQFTRADGGWVVRAGSGGELASGDAAVPPLPVWFLGDGARSVTRVGTANQATPAAIAGAVWLTSYPPSADPATATRTAREVSVTGVPLGAPVRLPIGYAIYQATDRGLLLAPVSQGTGPQADKLWNPADPKASRTFSAVIAASPAEIAWTPPCAATCRVQLLDLATGRRSTVELPAGSFAEGAAFSPNGGLLGLQVMSDRGGAVHPTRSRVDGQRPADGPARNVGRQRHGGRLRLADRRRQHGRRVHLPGHRAARVVASRRQRAGGDGRPARTGADIAGGRLTPTAPPSARTHPDGEGGGRVRSR